MTWVEMLLLACAGGVVIGLWKSRTRWGKGLLLASTAAATVLLVWFGPEFLSDLL
jgi:hypothetical protein